MSDLNFSLFMGLHSSFNEPVAGVENREVKEKNEEVDLDLAQEHIFSPRAYNALLGNGIKYLSQLRKLSDEELLALKNLGRKTLEEIREAMIILEEKVKKHSMLSPVIASFYGIEVRLNYDNDIETPHIYAKFEDTEIYISTAEKKLDGYLPDDQYKILIAWITLHREELNSLWTNYTDAGDWSKIEPLISV